MSFSKCNLLASCALAVLAVLLVARPAAAQGSVTPSFGDGRLTLVGEGYRAGERVEITVRVAGASHRFTATADPRGRFRLETGLAVPPLRSVEIEARDEQGLTQATITSAPGAPFGPGTGAPLPPAPVSGAPPPAAPSPSVRMPTQLPRTGGPGGDTTPLLELAGAISLLCVGAGLAARGRTRRAR